MNNPVETKPDKKREDKGVMGTIKKIVRKVRKEKKYK